MSQALVAFAAFALDIFWGDPKYLPHPVVFMGKFINFGEKYLRKIFPSGPFWEMAAGTVLTAATAGASFLFAAAIVYLAYKINPALGAAANIFLCFQLMAANSLKKEALKVYGALKEGSLPKARKYLSRIVGRDTGNLSQEGVIKAAVESVAESASDGVTAPLFFIIIGGAPGGYLYKAVNTLDSMIGYKNERYVYFGRAAARLDDVLNFIPSRVTGALFSAATFFTGFDGKNSLKIFLRDRNKHPSPNSAQTEAACAGALGITLGGGSFYGGKFIEKPVLGDYKRSPGPSDILYAVRMTFTASFMAWAVFSIARIGAEFFFGV